MSKSSQVVDK